MELTVQKTRPARVPRRRLTQLATALLSAEGWPVSAEIDLWLCSDAEIRGLNLQHRGRDAATDVLSFPQYAPGDRPTRGLPAALGDVVISVDTAARQASERGVTLSREIEWLFVHATLHLLGYDDDTEEGLLEMVAKAERLVSHAG